MGTTIIAYEDIERFLDHVKCLEAVADAAWAVVVEPSLLWPYEEDERALALADALDALDKEEEDSDK